MVKTDPYSILVVCTGNICRSPMAEGMLKGRLPAHLIGKVAVASAGTHALHGNLAQPNAVTVMQGYGVDIGGHRARQLSRSMVTEADLVLVMEKFHLAFVKKISWFSPVSVRLLTEYDPQGEVHEVSDPMGESIDAYKASARIIDNCIQGVNTHLDTIFKNS